VNPDRPLLARSLAGALLLAMFVPGCARAPAPAAPVAVGRAPEFGDAFWKWWGDGRGELAGYELDTPRYGAPRHGVAVTIFVTETFSNARRVKADPGRHPKRDEFPVLKLNLVQDFPTGIYDYNLMTSAFTALTTVNGRPPGSPTKVSFSAQEWCGHVYAQVLFDVRYARLASHSYFDTEADSAASLEMPSDVLSEDALLTWARGFSAPVLAAGDSAEAPLLGSLRQSRLLHEPLVVSTARFRRAAARESVVVPAGSFDADVYSVTVPAGRTWTFWVEPGEPRRILMWSCSDGERARLLGSDRLAYWKLNAPGGEQYLARLGLTPRPPRTP
jgi:hypothetical protein